MHASNMEFLFCRDGPDGIIYSNGSIFSPNKIMCSCCIPAQESVVTSKKYEVLSLQVHAKTIIVKQLFLGWAGDYPDTILKTLHWNYPFSHHAVVEKFWHRIVLHLALPKSLLDFIHDIPSYHTMHGGPTCKTSFQISNSHHWEGEHTLIGVLNGGEVSCTIILPYFEEIHDLYSCTLTFKQCATL